MRICVGWGVRHSVIGDSTVPRARDRRGEEDNDKICGEESRMMNNDKAMLENMIDTQRFFINIPVTTA